MRVPLYIEFTGKNVLIIGGGGVGTARARKFREAGAEIRVLSLEFSEELVELSKEGKVELIRGDAFNENLLESLISWCDLVTVAVGDLRVNDTVIRLARRYKALVNLANDAERTEVVVPFEGEVDGIRFAVTTEGKSGVVARRVVDVFMETLKDDSESLYLLETMHHLKKYMKSKDVPVQLRMKLYFVISADEEFRNLVNEGKVSEARELAEKLVDEYVSGKRKIDESLVKIQF